MSTRAGEARLLRPVGNLLAHDVHGGVEFMVSVLPGSPRSLLVQVIVDGDPDRWVHLILPSSVDWRPANPLDLVPDVPVEVDAPEDGEVLSPGRLVDGVWKLDPPGWTDEQYEAEMREAFNGDFTMERHELFLADRAALRSRLRKVEEHAGNLGFLLGQTRAERDAALERVRVLTDENAKMHADLTRFYEFENAEYRAMRHDDESVRLFSPAEVAAERARAIEETFRDVFEMLDCEDFDLGQMKAWVRESGNLWATRAAALLSDTGKEVDDGR